MRTQNDIACWLIRRAARAAPPALKERLEEEWLADLHERCGPLTRLRFGLGCCWAMQAIARDFASKPLVAAGAGGNQSVFAFGEYARSWLPRRPGAMLLIIAFHVLVVLAFTSSFVTRVMPHSTPEINLVDFKPTVQQPEPPLAKPRVVLDQPRFDPIPNHQPIVFPEDPPTTPSDTNRELSLPAGPTGDGPIAPAHRVQGGPGTGFPATDDFYPSVSKQLNEQGVAAVNVCVDAKGRLTSAPTLMQSAGSARLDAGALRLAQAGSGHYRPTQESGQPVNSCYAFRIRFMLRQTPR